MARRAYSALDRRFGAALSDALRDARGDRTARAISDESGVALDTLRAIESGRVVSPGLLVVGQLAASLSLTLDDLYNTALQSASTPGPADV